MSLKSNKSIKLDADNYILSFKANFSFFSLVESPPRDLQITAYKINNGLLMRNAIQLCLAANNILHMCKGNRAFLLLAIALM